MPIVLASASPRRQELLKNAGINFVVRPANIEEIQRAGEDPVAFVERLARDKARAVLDSADAEDAARMLRLLADRQHFVITGVCLIGTGFEDADFEDIRSEKTVVHFAPLPEAEIRDYVSTGEPMDKAGAYAIQGRASRWISKIEGDYFNVVGLPVDLVWRMLREHGVQ